MEPDPWQNQSVAQPPDEAWPLPEPVQQNATRHAGAGLVAWTFVSALIIWLEYVCTDGFRFTDDFLFSDWYRRETSIATASMIAVTLVLTAPLFAGFVVHGKAAGISFLLSLFLLAGFTFILYLIPDSGAGEIIGLCILAYMLYAFFFALGVILCAICRCFYHLYRLFRCWFHIQSLSGKI